MDPSDAVRHLPTDLQQEYTTLLARTRGEISAVEGMTTIHSMLIDRFVLQYCMLRYMERTSLDNLDLQRYNQLTDIWRKVGSDLLGQYKEIVKNGAVNEIIIAQVMTIVGEEVTDHEVIARIRARIATAIKEEEQVIR